MIGLRDYRHISPRYRRAFSTPDAPFLHDFSMPNGENGAMATSPRRPYRSYLLRLWQVYDDGHRTWRASLESAQTGEVRHFASLAEMIAYLAQQIHAAADQQKMAVLKQLFQDW